MDYQIAEAGPEDRQRLLDFAQRTYAPGAPQADGEHWDYTFGAGRCRLWFAHDHTGRVLGQMGCVEAQCMAAGAPLGVAWHINTMVSPEARGKGIATALRQTITHHYPVGGTLGSTVGSVGVAKALGWSELPEIPRYVRIVRPGYYISRAARLRSLRRSARDLAIAAHYRQIAPRRESVPPGDLDVRPITRFDQRVNELADRTGSCYGFIGDRRPEELNHRFLCHPVIRASALEAVREEQMLGYVVLAAVDRDGERIGSVLDWLFDPTTPQIGRLLLERACSVLANADVHRIVAWFHPRPLQNLLVHAGFGCWPGTIRGMASPALAARLADSERPTLLTHADSNLHEEALLVGFAEAREYRFVELGLQ